MASAQTVMVVLDIEYRYVGHGESSGARNMQGGHQSTPKLK
jgi:hypothetical protein